ncbi:hypothetical protein BDA96_03G023500 [Sorghum bicolor]|uniref:Uncharacterized protein n=1 Tax=Sorghum bicolor TaxID=4558 RepID=A0A921RAH2_SORBI|nr:hypothetical protein BDA96_03G023500 [Sorghum bicolor]
MEKDNSILCTRLAPLSAFGDVRVRFWTLLQGE